MIIPPHPRLKILFAVIQIQTHVRLSEACVCGKGAFLQGDSQTMFLTSRGMSGKDTDSYTAYTT